MLEGRIVGPDQLVNETGPDEDDGALRSRTLQEPLRFRDRIVRKRPLFRQGIKLCPDPLQIERSWAEGPDGPEHPARSAQRTTPATNLRSTAPDPSPSGNAGRSVLRSQGLTDRTDRDRSR